YRIVYVCFFQNISACLLGSFVFRLNLYPMFNPLYITMMSNSGWLTASYSLSFLLLGYSRGAYYLNCLSEFLGILLAFNRFTSLYFAILHDKVLLCYWTSTAIVVVLCLAVATAPVWFLFDDPTRFKLSDDLNAPFEYYFIHADANYCEDSIWFNMAVVTFCCNGLSSILYFACLVRLCLFSSTRHATAERNMFIVGLLNDL
ncbi:hypothetical protein PENTCL1PPCAC_16391, partial [Pristionchus entomophagus]